MTPALSFGSSELTPGEDATAEEVQGMFDKILTLLNDTKLDTENFQTGGVALADIIAGTVGKMLLAGTDGTLAYKSMGGAATINKDGTVTLTKPSIGNITPAGSVTPLSTAYHTLCSTPALAAGLYAVWANVDVTVDATNDYHVNCTALLQDDGVQVSPVARGFGTVGENNSGQTAKFSIRLFELLDVAAGSVLHLKASTAAAFVTTFGSGDTRLRYAKLFG